MVGDDIVSSAGQGEYRNKPSRLELILKGMWSLWNTVKHKNHIFKFFSLKLNKQETLEKSMVKDRPVKKKFWNGHITERRNFKIVIL